MMRPYICGTAFLIAAVLVGCGPAGTVKEKRIEVKQQAALDEAKNLLNRYAEGQQVGSEAEDYPRIVEQVQRTDADRAAILKAGFEELAKPGTNTKAKAKEMLKELAPKQGI